MQPDQPRERTSGATASDPASGAGVAQRRTYIDVVTRNAFQAEVVTAFGVDTSAWDRARIS
ncbi:MAG: hypothetical protein LC808_07645 [Actinobacteria bacterium]|nr:hypothetical protein [Actinomycetota bacterium]